MLRVALARIHPRDRLLVVLGLETGLRTSELLSLSVVDVWDGRAPSTVLRVIRRNLKGGRGERARTIRSRIIPLNTRAQEAIADYFAGFERHASEPLFVTQKSGVGPMTRRHASRAIRAVFLAAGLSAHKAWAGHSLRRRFVRRIYDSHGINAARAAVGHRWISTTQLYLGLDEEIAHEAILLLGKPSCGDRSGTRREQCV